MTTPTFHLTACPVCSSLVLAERPHWRLARMTTQKTGKPTYILTGCPHAEEVGRGKLRDDPVEWSLVEESWVMVADQLFAVRTERWTEPERSRFARALVDRAFLPNTTESLGLAMEEQPAPVAATKREDDPHDYI